MSDYIKGTAEAWESGDLGRSAEHAIRSSIDDLTIDEALELKSISIRMPKPLLEDLKVIAETNNIGYQVLIKKVLNRFVEEEKRIALNEKLAAKESQTKDDQYQRLAM